MLPLMARPIQGEMSAVAAPARNWAAFAERQRAQITRNGKWKMENGKWDPEKRQRTAALQDALRRFKLCMKVRMVSLFGAKGF
jgi:hypothetical protein